ncbi:MAG TPA: hypothetical protein VLD67_07530 [Vicinamibacterales bacterium]|nr:hypothetical protein [Vicinamibacterales bacterium]
MKKLLLVPAAGLAALALAAPARAQFGIAHPSYGDEARQPFYQSRRVAYDNGYREGLKLGEKHARKRDRFEYRTERTWQRGDKGYHRTYGDREWYRQSFRAGFEAGYTNGYRRVAGYGWGGYGSGRAVPRDTNPYPGGRYQYPGQYGYGYGFSWAREAGLRDGYQKGREDARDRDRFDPVRHSWYRSGDRGYKREYGPKEQYENAYREAFRDGYERGYRDWRYSR